MISNDEEKARATYILWCQDHPSDTKWDSLNSYTREFIVFMVKWSQSPYLKLDGTLLGQ